VTIVGARRLDQVDGIISAADLSYRVFLKRSAFGMRVHSGPPYTSFPRNRESTTRSKGSSA
jgi:hypothetical protein